MRQTKKQLEDQNAALMTQVTNLLLENSQMKGTISDLRWRLNQADRRIDELLATMQAGAKEGAFPRR